tara:strand:- start:47833 stop:48585 length:753 start_codon:yes stop_codon:yes gene_type:complete
MDLTALKSQGLVRPCRATSAPSKLPFPFGLGKAGVHELVETRFGDFAALTGFACAALSEAPPRSVLWVAQARFASEFGLPRQEAIRGFWRGDVACLFVSPRKLDEALWVVEEGVTSGAVSLVVAELAGADFTATRRLTLASRERGVPVVALMPYTREGVTAAEARWRVSPRASSPNKYDPQAPGRMRWRAELERSRTAPEKAGAVFDLEFDDETFSLSLVPGLAARPVAPREVGKPKERSADIRPFRQTG